MQAIWKAETLQSNTDTPLRDPSAVGADTSGAEHRKVLSLFFKHKWMAVWVISVPVSDWIGEILAYFTADCQKCSRWRRRMRQPRITLPEEKVSRQARMKCFWR